MAAKSLGFRNHVIMARPNDLNSNTNFLLGTSHPPSFSPEAVGARHDTLALAVVDDPALHEANIAEQFERLFAGSLIVRRPGTNARRRYALRHSTSR